MISSPFHLALAAWVLLAIVVFPILLRIRAPYGRHRTAGWGPEVNHRLGWFLMELPALIVLPVACLWPGHTIAAPVIVFLGLWEIHYVNRVIAFPLRMGPSTRRMPLAIVGAAAFFNIINGLLNGIWFQPVQGFYGPGWFSDPRFLAGAVLFAGGMGINMHADNVLLRLRKRNAGEYGIPEGGLFRFVSSPNYLGEIIEWVGFAIMTWSPAAAAFALWTAANLVPRALANHRWYKDTFDSYPQDRTALVPLLF